MWSGITTYRSILTPGTFSLDNKYFSVILPISVNCICGVNGSPRTSTPTGLIISESRKQIITPTDFKVCRGSIYIQYPLNKQLHKQHIPMISEAEITMSTILRSTRKPLLCMLLIRPNMLSYFDPNGLKIIVRISSKISSIIPPQWYIAGFAFVLQRLRSKPIPLCRAGVYSRRLIGLNLSLRREQAPALRCDSIITQIGRRNNPSAEICWHICRGGVSPPVLSLKI